MYRLLIVDDEAVIADGLYEVFQGLKDMELDVYKAYSGMDALHHLNRTRIDIVLTDIRMPGMDGLQLLEKIHAKWPKCKVIFLTGYNEFEYIYTAIQYEGVSYLLKTEGYGKIISAVVNAIADMEKGFKLDALLQQAKEQLGTTRVLMQEIYLKSILKGELTLNEINQQQFDELEMELNAKEPVLLLAGRIDNLSKGCIYSQRTKQLYTLKLIMEQYLSSHINFVYFLSENDTLVWFIQPNKDQTESADCMPSPWTSILTFIKGNVELIQEAFLQSVGDSISFSLDDRPAGWNEIPERFFTLKMLLNYRIGKSSGMLLTDKSVIEKDIQYSRENSGKTISNRQKLDMLAEMLEYGKKDDFEVCMNELTAGIINTESMHDIVALEKYYSMALILISYINKWNLTEKIAFRIGLYKLMNADAHESWGFAAEYLKQLGKSLFEIQNTEEEKRAQDATSMVQKHIMDHIHLPDEVSLVRLAELVYFNPSYLSRLFKQVTGINLSDYISEYRIKKAKQLLENPDARIHEVAEAVGYGSATNFARFFKKLTNMTPQEYRDFTLIK